MRRRRYNRKMVSDVPMPVVFKIIKESSKKTEEPDIFNMAPRYSNPNIMFLVPLNSVNSSLE